MFCTLGRGKGEKKGVLGNCDKRRVQSEEELDPRAKARLV